MSTKNKVSEALRLAESKLGKNSALMKHTNEVVKACEEWAEFLGLGGEETDIILSAATLLNIGLAPDINKTNNKFYDGYIYLSNNGWHSRITNLILNQTNGLHLYEKVKPKVIETILANPVSEDNQQLHKVLTVSSFLINEDGEEVLIDDKIRYYSDEFGPNHPITLHAIELSFTVSAWVLDLRFSN